MSQEQIGRYEIIREIGRGGMATVYLAHDPRFRRDVAIKVLPRQFTHDPRFLERFTREAQTIAALEHYAIVPVYDFGEHKDAPYLVMRYMTGGSLRKRMTGQPLPLPEITQIYERLAPALDKAHQRGVIHRDLKPDNVLFDEENMPYLADFGIARLAEATQTMTIVGTPSYMSPEQVQGDVALDGRSDIYGLGVMLYELLCGQQPYVADTPTKQMIKHVLEPIPNILAINSKLPFATQKVINRVMAKKPQERYPTAVALVTALKTLIQPETMVESAALATPPSQIELTVIDTPPEISPILDRDALSQRSVRLDESQPDTDRKPFAKLPTWAWWSGALVLLLLVAMGLNGIMNNESPDHATVTEIGNTVAAVLSGSPTATLNPDLPPPEPTRGSNWLRPKDEMTMLYVPGGTFPMGSNDGSENEQPIHDVTLDAFWIDQTEVTNAQYMRCVADGTCMASRYADNAIYNGKDLPVVGVSWSDAEAYCQWTGGQFPAQLPTEAQWEYAARGPDGNKYPWGDEKPDCSLAQFADCDRRTAPVASFQDGASWIGVLDMAGNVWEWTNDWYASDYYKKSPAENPQGPASSEQKVLRGGAWFNFANFARSANRNYNDSTDASIFVGFRCAQE